ncbi:MAG: four helix bundle protein [Bacteroidales bacterium]
MNKKEFVEAKDLKVYQLARQLSKLAWEIYESLSWQDKKIMGDQFIESTDSVGANIIEGYGRYHYLDKIRFYYIARASLNESAIHWLELLLDRNKINHEQYKEMIDVAKDLQVKLNNFIGSTYNQYKKSKNNEIK